MSETVGSQGLDAETIKKLLDGSYGEATPPGWKKDNRLSTNQQKVYIHELSGKVVVSHRGTVGTAQDWFNNAMYGVFGDRGYELTGRYKKAKKTQQKAEKKYGADNITTIGHSQGGLLAQKVGGDSAEIITLNKATRPQDFFQRKRGEKQTDIRTEGDVVSMFKNPFETQGEQVTIKTDKFNPLAEHATDVLDRMKKDHAADQAPEWSTKSRPPGTMISRVGRLISKSLFGRGPKHLEGGNEHDDPYFDEVEPEEEAQAEQGRLRMYGIMTGRRATIERPRQYRDQALRALQEQMEFAGWAPGEREHFEESMGRIADDEGTHGHRTFEERRENLYDQIREIISYRPYYRGPRRFGSEQLTERDIEAGFGLEEGLPRFFRRQMADQFINEDRVRGMQMFDQSVNTIRQNVERDRERRRNRVSRRARAEAQQRLADRLPPEVLQHVDGFARRRGDDPNPRPRRRIRLE